MWENGGFGAEAGGFMNESNIEANANVETKKGGRGPQRLASVTCSMLNDNTQESLIIEGFEFSMLKLVGLVRKVDESSTKTSYVIDDHTGQVNVTQFNEENDDGTHSAASGVAEGHYVKLYGNIRFYQGKPSVLCFKITQIEDPNLITTHLLEVVQQSHMLSSLMNGGAGGKIKNEPQQVFTPVLENSTVQAIPKMPGREDGQSVHDVVVRIIKNTISSDPNCSGVSRDLIKVSVKNFSAAEVDQSIDYLQGQGMIYSSLDEDHFLMIDN